MANPKKKKTFSLVAGPAIDMNQAISVGELIAELQKLVDRSDGEVILQFRDSSNYCYSDDCCGCCNSSFYADYTVVKEETDEEMAARVEKARLKRLAKKQK